MTYILGIIIIIIGLIIINRMNNNKPLSVWPNDKLKKTHEKSLVVADVLQKRGNTSKAKEYVKRADELKVEMDKRGMS